jgi:hypothetical protein
MILYLQKPLFSCIVGNNGLPVRNMQPGMHRFRKQRQAHVRDPYSNTGDRRGDLIGGRRVNPLQPSGEKDYVVMVVIRSNVRVHARLPSKQGARTPAYTHTHTYPTVYIYHSRR